MSFRALPNLTGEEKDREIKAVKQHLNAIKQTVLDVLANHNAEINVNKQ